MSINRSEKIMTKKHWIFVCLFGAAFAGCEPSNKSTPNTTGSGTAGTSSGKPATFTLAWSEYPSWSVFGVADEIGLLNKEAGKLGELEKKWNVDIVLKGVDYDTCLQMYGSNTADAVCITNMDTLGPATDRASVAILPTSTSVGADACIAVGVNDLEGLKGKTTRGLERSVSQYAFERILIKKGLNPKDFPFSNMDPGAAASALQTGDSNVQSIMVWNPFVMQTLRDQPKSKKLFDSSEIPEEIIDMVVVGKDCLAKEGGKAFASCIVETFYAINQRMADPKTADKTLVAIGANFSSLGLEDMKQVVQQTRFYKSPEEALKLLSSEEFRTKTMPVVADFCVEHKIVEKKPTIGFDSADSQVNFDTSFLKAATSGK
jgi:ABC-type nitrate/sulfonate/bicarbonate transport system substrate-binding protein